MSRLVNAWAESAHPTKLVTPFREWKRYTPALQAHMKAALQTIVDSPNLSSDVFEVVSKSLKG